MKTYRLIAKHQREEILSTIQVESPETMKEKNPHTIKNNHLVCFRMKPEREVLRKAIHNSPGA
jgi:hypothetical protein